MKAYARVRGRLRALDLISLDKLSTKRDKAAFNAIGRTVPLAGMDTRWRQPGLHKTADLKEQDTVVDLTKRDTVMLGPHRTEYCSVRIRVEVGIRENTMVDLAIGVGVRVRVGAFKGATYTTFWFGCCEKDLRVGVFKVGVLGSGC